MHLSHRSLHESGEQQEADAKLNAHIYDISRDEECCCCCASTTTDSAPICVCFFTLSRFTCASCSKLNCVGSVYTRRSGSNVHLLTKKLLSVSFGASVTPEKMKIKLCLLCDDRRDSLHTAAFCSPFKRKILLLFSSNQCAGSIRWDIVSDQLSRCDMTTNLGFLSSVDPFWSVAHSTIHRILRTYTFPFARASRDLLITQLIYWTGGRSLFSIAVSIPCDQQQQQQHIDPRNAVRNRVTVFLLLYFLCVYIAL